MASRSEALGSPWRRKAQRVAAGLLPGCRNQAWECYTGERCQKGKAHHMMSVSVSFRFQRQTWTQECECVANCKHSVISWGLGPGVCVEGEGVREGRGGKGRGAEEQQHRTDQRLSQTKMSCSNTAETGPQICNRRMLDVSPAAQMVLRLCFGRLKGGV